MTPSIHRAFGDAAAVPEGAVFGRPLLRLVVYPGQAEARRVAVRPFEVVHERPGDAPGDRHARLHRSVSRLEVVAEEGDPAVVLDAAARVGSVGIARPVLGDVDLGGAGFEGDARQTLEHPRGGHPPADNGPPTPLADPQATRR